MAPSPEEMTQSMINNMPEKTGKSLPEWLAIVLASDLSKHGEIVKYLKSEHGMTHGFANLVAHEFRAAAADTPPPAGDDLVEAQYAGAKSALRPIYDALATRITAFGSDVEFAPKKAYVSLRRNKQFGLINPATRTRVDVGINLKDHPGTERLEVITGANNMVSHNVRVTSVDEVDDELIGWLRASYDIS